MATETAQQIIDEITGKLRITRTYLAGMLGVSERTLNEWRGRSFEDLPPKGVRLLRLAEVAKMIEVEGNFHGPEILSVLQNGRVALGGDDEDTESVSLLGYINAFPKDGGWRANVAQAIEEYKTYVANLRGRRNAAV